MTLLSVYRGRNNMLMWLVGLLFLAILPLSGRASDDEATMQTHTYKVGGIEREYKIYLPKALPKDAPLVLVLHGYGGNAAPEAFVMNQVAEKNGFAVCYPQGEKDGRGKKCWNVGYPFQKDMTINDVKFLCKLARHLHKKFALSSVNVFCTGHSNGGEMCYLLAYRKPDVFAAVAPISGLTLEWMYRKYACHKPIPVFEVHGTKDKTSAWNGDPENKGGWGAYIAVPLAVNYWATQNKCTHEVTGKLPVKDQENGHYVITHKYVNGIDKNEVWLYEIVNGTHSWGVKDLNTAEEIWGFFKKFVK